MSIRQVFPVGPAFGVLLALLCLVLAAGCSGEQQTVRFVEVKLIRDKLRPEELDAFLRIINALPDKKLPKLPSFFPAPPDWSPDRTLSVGELTAEDEQRIEQATSIEWLAARLPRDRRLERALLREQMSRQQFAAMALAVGMALARTAVPASRDLKQWISRGEAEIEHLKDDERPFFNLSLEEMHAVRQASLWIARLDRASRLDLVPPENIALVNHYREQLALAFPEECLTDPLAPLADPLEERGVPFEELPETGSDENISWQDLRRAANR